MVYQKLPLCGMSHTFEENRQRHSTPILQLECAERFNIWKEYPQSMLRTFHCRDGVSKLITKQDKTSLPALRRGEQCNPAKHQPAMLHRCYVLAESVNHPSIQGTDAWI